MCSQTLCAPRFADICKAKPGTPACHMSDAARACSGGTAQATCSRAWFTVAAILQNEERTKPRLMLDILSHVKESARDSTSRTNRKESQLQLTLGRGVADVACFIVLGVSEDIATSARIMGGTIRDSFHIIEMRRHY